MIVTSDQINVSSDQFLMAILDIFLSEFIFFNEQFHFSFSFTWPVDQFEKGDDQNWSQNQLTRLVMSWSWPYLSQEPQDPRLCITMKDYTENGLNVIQKKDAVLNLNG